MFAIDRSGSIHRDRFLFLLDFVANVTKEIDVGFYKARIAAISFADNANMEVNIAYRDKGMYALILKDKCSKTFISRLPFHYVIIIWPVLWHVNLQINPKCHEYCANGCDYPTFSLRFVHSKRVMKWLTP